MFKNIYRNYKLGTCNIIDIFYKVQIGLKVSFKLISTKQIFVFII